MFDLQFNESEYLADLKTALLHEFDALYQKHQDQGIYAFALVLDDLLVAQYSTVSTKKSLLSEAENKNQYLQEEDKWHVEKWQYRAQTNQGITLFTRKMSQYFQQTRIGLTNIHAKDRFNQNALNFYLQGMEDAKDEIIETYHLTANRITFIVHLPSNPSIAITSLERLNPPSSTLFEAIANLQSTIISQGKTKFKLSQVDKEILIDLGQALEMVPYDDMQVAQQAYMLSLEPYFLETSPYIQNLINEIASMDSSILVISKEQIKDRIDKFYVA